MNPEQIYDLISRRRTVHRFKVADIDVSLIKKGLEVALTAPNHNFTFPWQFVICGKQTQQKLFEQALQSAVFKAKAAGEDVLKIKSKVTEKFLNPSCMVFFARKRNAVSKMAHEDYASVACAVQNFTLYMLGHGYDCKWSTGSLSQSKETLDLLGLKETEYVIDGLILVGKPLLDQHPPRRRPELEEVLKELP